jgi:hypothetical protein
MGRTDNFFPPIANEAEAEADADAEVCWAAAADAEVSWAAAADAGAADEAASVPAACAKPVGTAVPETVVTPLTDTGALVERVPPTLDGAAKSDAVFNEVVTEADEDVDVEDAGVEDVGVDDADVEVGVSTEDDGDVEESGGETEEDVADDDVELEEELLPSVEPLFCVLAFIVIEHFFTSSTAGSPLLSVMGVRVTTHVSVIAPATVSAVCTVNTVVDRPFEPATLRVTVGLALTGP